MDSATVGQQYIGDYSEGKVNSGACRGTSCDPDAIYVCDCAIPESAVQAFTLTEKTPKKSCTGIGSSLKSLSSSRLQKQARIVERKLWSSRDAIHPPEGHEQVHPG